MNGYSMTNHNKTGNNTKITNFHTRTTGFIPLPIVKRKKISIGGLIVTQNVVVFNDFNWLFLQWLWERKILNVFCQNITALNTLSYHEPAWIYLNNKTKFQHLWHKNFKKANVWSGTPYDTFSPQEEGLSEIGVG